MSTITEKKLNNLKNKKTSDIPCPSFISVSASVDCGKTGGKTKKEGENVHKCKHE